MKPERGVPTRIEGTGSLLSLFQSLEYDQLKTLLLTEVNMPLLANAYWAPTLRVTLKIYIKATRIF